MRRVTIPLPSIAPGRSVLIDIDGAAILLCRTTTGLHACAAICPHQHRTLEGSRVRGPLLLCPWHGASFDLETGASKSPQLTDRPLAIHRCSEDGDYVTIALDDAE